MPADVAMLRGRTFAAAVAEQVDQTGALMLEARVWPPADVEMRSLVHQRPPRPSRSRKADVLEVSDGAVGTTLSGA